MCIIVLCWRQPPLAQWNLRICISSPPPSPVTSRLVPWHRPWWNIYIMEIRKHYKMRLSPESLLLNICQHTLSAYVYLCFMHKNLHLCVFFYKDTYICFRRLSMKRWEDLGEETSLSGKQVSSDRRWQAQCVSKITRILCFGQSEKCEEEKSRRSGWEVFLEDWI